SGYDLPPLAFTGEELAAIRVGLGLLARTGDSDLIDAARSARDKIAAENSAPQEATAYISDWGATRLPVHRMALIREAIATERALDLIYRDSSGGETSRRIWPLAVVYYAEADILASWCCLRSGLRHFRADRVERLVATDETFLGKGRRLRDEWRASQRHLMSDSVGLGSFTI
ncbi:MAG: WYL domain-containing protein, partial [Pseudomonadota bacterium]